MKPLVYWCRWHNARLRLRGREAGAVFGELAFADGMQRFHYDLQRQILTIGTGDSARQVLLDELGVESPIDSG
jgi:hypothetical protein